MYWNKDPRYRGGGYWRCRVKKQEQNKPHTRRYLRRLRNQQDQKAVDRILAENPWLEELMNGKTLGTEGRERTVA